MEHTEIENLLKILKKTNDFVQVVAVRYGLEDKQIVSSKVIVLPGKSTDITFNFILLVDYLFKTSTDKKLKSTIIDMSKRVGMIREHIISKLTNNEYNKNFDDPMVDNSFKIINKTYKSYVIEIHENNILGDFLSKNEVQEKLQEKFDKLKSIV